MDDITTTADAYEAFDDYLDTLEVVTLGTLPYPASRVLLAVDPIAYRCGFNDWCDAEGIDVDALEGSLYRH